MTLEKRNNKAKSLLREGIVPGSIYGKDIESTAVQLDGKKLLKLVKEFGTNSTFKVEVDGDKHIVYFKDLQRDYMDRRKIIHFSLHKVSAGETLTTEVPLNFVGHEVIQQQNLLLQEVLNKLEVEFTVGQGVNHIDVDVSELEVNHAIYARDVILPKGFKLHTREEEMIVNVAYAKTVALEEEEKVEETEVEETESATAEEE